MIFNSHSKIVIKCVVLFYCFQMHFYASTHKQSIKTKRSTSNIRIKAKVFVGTHFWVFFTLHKFWGVTENGGTSPAKKKWAKKGYNPDVWRPDLAGVSAVAPCSLWRPATTPRKASTSFE